MGFYFFALSFVLSHKRRLAAIFVMLFALLWGALIGWVRIGMGGHFASDVLWAGGIVYLVSFALFQAFKAQSQPLL
jgi:membrane-associated PAP2 superfamily phosphatase